MSGGGEQRREKCIRRQAQETCIWYQERENSHPVPKRRKSRIRNQAHENECLMLKARENVRETSYHWLSGYLIYLLIGQLESNKSFVVGKCVAWICSEVTLHQVHFLESFMRTSEFLKFPFFLSASRGKENKSLHLFWNGKSLANDTFAFERLL